MKSTVLVPDSNIFISLKFFESFVCCKCVPGDSPPGGGIEVSKKKVHNRVNIRGHVVPGDPDIFSCIDDHRDVLVLYMTPHTLEELGCARPARKKRDHYSIHLSPLYQDSLPGSHEINQGPRSWVRRG